MAVPPGPETAKVPEASVHICPGCGLPLTEQILSGTDFHCTACGLEMAHMLTTGLGAPRTVIRWLCSPGDLVLDRYKIEKVLGKGGFAATYLAQDLRIHGKKRALKEIPESLYDATETELLSHLSHPAIPDITDQCREGGMVYLVLEFGGGRTLEAERKSAGGKVPYQRVLGWMQQLGLAISYLHAQDPPIIHRDLKPDNILLDDLGAIMLVDFGIAKQAVDGGQTRIIARAATHGFSPPEQAMGTGTDPRSDVYALAATAYALITGVIPTPAHERIAGKPLTDPVDLVPDLPPRIAEALLQALTLNINQRMGTVEQFMQALGLSVVPTGDFAATTRTVMVGDVATLGSLPQATSVRIRSEHVTVAPSAPVVRAGPRVGVWVAAGLAVLTLGAGGAWLLLNRPSGSASAPTVNPASAGGVPRPVSGQGLPPQATAVTNTTPTAKVPEAGASTQSTGAGQVQPGLGSVLPTTSFEHANAAAQPQTTSAILSTGAGQVQPGLGSVLPTTSSEHANVAAQPQTTSAMAILNSLRPEPPPPVQPRVELPPVAAAASTPRQSKPKPLKPPPSSSSGTSSKGWVFNKGSSFKTD